MHEVTHVTWGHHIDQSVLSYFLSIFKLEKWMPDHVFICIDQQRLLQVFSVKELINCSSFLPLDVNHKTRKLAKSNSCLLSHDSNVQSVWNFWRSVIEKQKRSQTQRCLLFSRLQKWGQKFVCVLLDLFLDRHLLHLLAFFYLWTFNSHDRVSCAPLFTLLCLLSIETCLAIYVYWSFIGHIQSLDQRL